MATNYKLITLFIAALATAGVANAQASKKPASELLSRTTKEQIDAGAIRVPTRQASAADLPSEKPMPEKALEAKLKHEQRFGVSTLPDSEKKKRLPSNARSIEELKSKSRRPTPPQPPSN